MSIPFQLFSVSGFYNRDEKCLQRGADWVFKYSSLRFGCKGLIRSVDSKEGYALIYVAMFVFAIGKDLDSIFQTHTA